MTILQQQLLMHSLQTAIFVYEKLYEAECDYQTYEKQKRYISELQAMLDEVCAK